MEKIIEGVLMARTDRKGYDAMANTIADHPSRVVEDRRNQPGRLYYITQKIYNTDGKLVAFHDEGGNFWIAR